LGVAKAFHRDFAPPFGHHVGVLAGFFSHGGDEDASGASCTRFTESVRQPAPSQERDCLPWLASFAHQAW
jgi:hypothetical protein